MDVPTTSEQEADDSYNGDNHKRRLKLVADLGGPKILADAVLSREPRGFWERLFNGARIREEGPVKKSLEEFAQILVKLKIAPSMDEARAFVPRFDEGGVFRFVNDYGSHDNFEITRVDDSDNQPRYSLERFYDKPHRYVPMNECGSWREE